jgi:hypothetical protein
MTAIDCGVLLAPAAESVTVPAWFPMGSPLILAPTAKEPLLVPDAAAPPFTVSQGTDEVAVQFNVPDPLLVTVTVWLDGEAPFWVAENEMEAGLRAITGANGAEGETVAVGVVRSWVNPGIVADRFFIPRPLLEPPPPLEEPGAATPDRDEKPDDVGVIGLESAPATATDVVDVVVVIDDFVGATVLDAAEFRTVASLLWT